MEIFTGLAANPDASKEMRDSARYRAAKVHEKLGENDQGIDIYVDIVYDYEIDAQSGAVRDWYYFARSGYDAARLLLLAGKDEEAARIYERLARSGIPTAEEARARAEEIRSHRREEPK